VSTPTITGDSRIRLYPLQMRPDHESWYVGRVETGEFVALPGIAVEALRLLGDELTTDEVAARLRQAHSRDIDVKDFVENLLELGYVAAVDEQPIIGPEPIKPTWPWLRPRHARWALSPVTAVLALAVPLLAVGALFWRPELVPGYRDLLWSRHTSLIIVGNAAIAWSIIFLHELAHLVTARAAGVPGRITFRTQLQFLAVVTDVTGIWAAPRRVRMTVYLSGMVVELFLSGTALLASLALGPDSSAGEVLRAVALLALLFVPTQFLLFMRTDLYFVLQDLARCSNLYVDGSAYVRYQGRRLARLPGRHQARPADPSIALPAPERRAVRAYAPVLAVGTALCLLFAVVVTVPTALTVLSRAVRNTAGTGPGGRLDGGLTLAFTGSFWALWCRTWWSGHAGQVTGWWTRHRPGIWEGR
jgi:putative peptide zinc metalloprotease protein